MVEAKQNKKRIYVLSILILGARSFETSILQPDYDVIDLLGIVT